MSGSGGGGWAPAPTQSDCGSLSQITTLNSPQIEVLAQLQSGIILDIVLLQKGKVAIVQAVYQGSVAGTITSSIIQRIAECIDSGFEYVAEVLDITGGACKVKVRAK